MKDKNLVDGFEHIFSFHKLPELLEIQDLLSRMIKERMEALS